MNQEPLNRIEELQAHLTEVQTLLSRHKLVEDLVHRQDMPRHELVEGMVHQQNLAALQKKLDSMPAVDIARILEALPEDDRLTTWLQVRDDNPGAIDLYTGLGFQEQARRTKWQAAPDKNLPNEDRDLEIRIRSASQWPAQREWMQRLYPENLAWYQPTPWIRFRPGLFAALYRFFIESETRIWTISGPSGLLAAISWLAGFGWSGQLWAALPEQIEAGALTALLLHVRRVLAGREPLTLDMPGGEAVDPIQAAGFSAQRTLVWMRFNTTLGTELRK
jgi:hypothetical protein